MPNNTPIDFQIPSDNKLAATNFELNDYIEPDNNRPTANVVDGPTRGTIALEFSLSPQYINTTVMIFYISDEIVKEIFSFLSPRERGKCATVCKTWKHIDLASNYLYKIDCLKIWGKDQSRPEKNVFMPPFDDSKVLWGEEFPETCKESDEYLKSFKN